jgi:hypothetical protein
VLKAGEGASSVGPYGRGLDLAVQSLDPSGDTVWITHAYANAKGDYSMAWGSVKP